MVKTHRQFKQKLDNYHLNNLVNENAKNKSEHETLLDTVGAVCVDRDGNLASAVSSGGILLKHPGRVGHASINIQN